MDSVLALLVIGDLGEAGRLSLESMAKLNHRRMCIAANNPGKKWIQRVATPRDLQRICFHSEIVENFEDQRFSSKKEYSEYRTNDFRILTLLKWDLISEVFQKHESVTEVLFSDLDIYWIEDPTERISQIKKEHTTVLVQSNSTPDRPGRVCTGIMSWHQTTTTATTLLMVRAYHAQKIRSGEIQDDEDTFNQLVSLGEIDTEMQRLPESEFEVGKNFPRMIFRSALSALNQTFCFHANYVIGLTQKAELLSAAQQYYEKNSWPWKILLKFWALPIARKLRKLLTINSYRAKE